MGNLAARRGDLGASAARLRPATGYDVVRMLLGLLLLVAAALKAHQLATEPVLGTGLLDSRWVLIATVEFELFFGLWLLAGLLPRLSWAAAICCFGLFACVSLAKALGGAASCGCFGRVEVNPWYTSALDVASVLALLLWRPRGLSRFLWRGTVPIFVEQKWDCPLALAAFPVARAMAVVVVWLSVGIPAGVAMGAYQPTLLGEDGVLLGPDNLVILEPEKWIGKRFPLLYCIDIGPYLASGPWVVLLYRHDCPNCQHAVADYPSLSRFFLERVDTIDLMTSHVAIVEVPPYRSPTSVALTGPPQGRLRNNVGWVVPTPLVLKLENDVLTACK